MPVKPSGKNFMSEFTRSGYLEKETIEAQGDLMRAFWKKYGPQVPPEIKRAYGFEEENRLGTTRRPPKRLLTRSLRACHAWGRREKSEIIS
jgi:hypothetical protein